MHRCYSYYSNGKINALVPTMPRGQCFWPGGTAVHKYVWTPKSDQICGEVGCDLYSCIWVPKFCLSSFHIWTYTLSHFKARSQQQNQELNLDL